MAAKGNTKSTVFWRNSDTKRKAKYNSPDDSELQGVLYLPKESVPAGKDIKVTIEFVDQED